MLLCDVLRPRCENATVEVARCDGHAVRFCRRRDAAWWELVDVARQPVLRAVVRAHGRCPALAGIPNREPVSPHVAELSIGQLHVVPFGVLGHIADQRDTRASSECLSGRAKANSNPGPTRCVSPSEDVTVPCQSWSTSTQSDAPSPAPPRSTRGR